MNKKTPAEETIAGIDTQLKIISGQLDQPGLGKVELHRLHQRMDKLLDRRSVLLKVVNNELIGVK